MSGLLGVSASKIQSKWDTLIADYYVNGTVLGCVMLLMDDYFPELKGCPLVEVILVLEGIGVKRMPLVSRKCLETSSDIGIEKIWLGVYRSMPITVWLSRAISPQAIEILMSMDPLERYVWLQDKSTKRVGTIDRVTRNERQRRRREKESTKFVSARELCSNHGKYDWNKVS